MMLDAQEDLFVARADGSGLRRLTNDVHKDREPEWTPDGQRIYFFSDRSGRYEIWSIHRDGSSLEQVTRSTGVYPGDPVMSPDGTSMIVSYATTDPARSAALFDLSSQSDQQTPRFLPPVDSETAFWPGFWSSDGARVAGMGYTVLADEEYDLWMIAEDAVAPGGLDGHGSRVVDGWTRSS